MSRRYAEHVAVRRGDDAPAQFLWRDRLYVVRAVLAHWYASGQWWRAPAAAAVFGGDHDSVPPPAADLVLSPIPPSPKWGQRAWGEPAPDVGASVGAVAVDDGEQEFWRVEAAPGRAAGTGIYDLCFTEATGRWTVAQVQD